MDMTLALLIFLGPALYAWARARDAAEQGALVLTRTRCEQAVPREGGWRATLARRDPAAGQVVRRLQVQARVVVNVAGAWAPGVLGD